MNEKRNGDPERNVLGPLCHRANQNSIHEESATKMKQEIENVIAGSRVAVE
jgi:hypothetical protein